MLAPTHSIFGVFLSLTILAVFGVKAGLHWSIILVTVLGSVLPDIDLPKSIIGRIFPFISKPLERKFGHRTITHSLIGWLIASVAFGLVVLGVVITKGATTAPLQDGLAIRWISAFSIGYISHLILDMFNPRGSQLFWPNLGRDVIPRNVNFRPEVGSYGEAIAFIIILVFLVASFPLSKYGVISSLRWLLATPDSVIQEYKGLNTKLLIEFEGSLRETKEQIKGEAEVLDIDRKKLIILFNGKVYSLTDEYSGDIISTKTRFKKTNIPLKIETMEFTNETREKLLKLIPKGGLISGEIYLPQGLDIVQKNAVNSFPSIEQRKNILVLNFASKEELRSLGLEEQYYLQLKKDQAELEGLRLKMRKKRQEIKNIENDDTLTPLGRQLLETKEEREKRTQKLADLEQDLKELSVQIEEKNLELGKRRFLFSGKVKIRY
jgi:inner membrane protein